jgi:hypothetical protein
MTLNDRLHNTKMEANEHNRHMCERERAQSLAQRPYDASWVHAKKPQFSSCVHSYSYSYYVLPEYSLPKSRKLLAFMECRRSQLLERLHAHMQRGTSTIINWVGSERHRRVPPCPHNQLTTPL